jgi:hypothetical protein
MLLASGTASAQGKAEHERRVATDLARLFESLDRDADRAVTRVEAAGDVNFLPLFSDIDINRDGVVTSDELARYLALAYGVKLESVPAAPAVASNASKPPATPLR